MKLVPSFVFALVAAVAASSASLAHEYSAGAIKIGHPWTRATPPGATTAVAYLRVTNTGNAPVRLTGGMTPVAQRVEIHTMSMEGGVMRMRPVPGIDIAPGQTVELKAGGLHLMLIGLNRQLMPEDLLPLTLTFAGAPPVPVELYVEGMGGGMSPHHQP